MLRKLFHPNKQGLLEYLWSARIACVHKTGTCTSDAILHCTLGSNFQTKNRNLKSYFAWNSDSVRLIQHRSEKMSIQRSEDLTIDGNKTTR